MSKVHRIEPCIVKMNPPMTNLSKPPFEAYHIHLPWLNTLFYHHTYKPSWRKFLDLESNPHCINMLCLNPNQSLHMKAFNLKKRISQILHFWMKYWMGGAQMMSKPNPPVEGYMTNIINTLGEFFFYLFLHFLYYFFISFLYFPSFTLRTVRNLHVEEKILINESNILGSQPQIFQFQCLFYSFLFLFFICLYQSFLFLFLH